MLQQAGAAIKFSLPYSGINRQLPGLTVLSFPGSKLILPASSGFCETKKTCSKKKSIFLG